MRLCLALLLALGCSSIPVRRPPVAFNLGSVYRPHVDSHQNWNLLGRVTVPTRPVGVWADVIYNFGESEIQSTSFGFIIVFPGGAPIDPAEEETIDDTPNIQDLTP